MIFDASPRLSARPIEGLRFRGPLAPRLRPAAKKNDAPRRYKSLSAPKVRQANQNVLIS